MIRARRVYAEPAPDDGYRVLVDRLWPRGLSKDRAHVDLWLKDVGPSDDLRRAFHGGAIDFAAFRDRYNTELDANPALDRLREVVDGHDVVTLLFGARDEEQNQAVLLRDRLEQPAGDR